MLDEQVEKQDAQPAERPPGWPTAEDWEADPVAAGKKAWQLDQELKAEIRKLEARTAEARARIEALKAQPARSGEQVSLPPELRDALSGPPPPPPLSTQELIAEHTRVIDGLSKMAAKYADDREFQAELLYMRRQGYAMRAKLQRSLDGPPTRSRAPQGRRAATRTDTSSRDGPERPEDPPRPDGLEPLAPTVAAELRAIWLRWKARL